MCFMCWCSPLVGICTEIRTQAVLPKHQDVNETWKAQWPRGHSLELCVETGATLDYGFLKTHELVW